MLRIVVDTNIWIRILLRGRVTLPVLSLWHAGRFQLIISQELLNEYQLVWQRPRLRRLIDARQAEHLYRQIDPAWRFDKDDNYASWLPRSERSPGAGNCD